MSVVEYQRTDGADREWSLGSRRFPVPYGIGGA